MRASKLLLAGSVAAVAAGLLIAQLWSARKTPIPPVLTVADIETAGLYDQSGTELWLVTINIANPRSGNPPSRPSVIFVKDGGKAVQAGRNGRWKYVECEGTSVTLGPRAIVGLGPGQQCKAQLLVPAGTEFCRIWLKFAEGAKKSPVKELVASIVTGLPQSIRARLSFTFWRWVGFPGWAPSSRWREIELELPLRLAPEGGLPRPPWPGSE